MKDYIAQRAMDIATYIIENNATVRQAAKQFGVSKSTVHADGTIRNGLCRWWSRKKKRSMNECRSDMPENGVSLLLI